jgi:glucose-6-phosphate isomerase
MTTLTEQHFYKKLQKHQLEVTKLHMKNLFAENPHRFDEFSVAAHGLFLDYSKNLITTETLNLLLGLAQDSHLSEKIKALFAGEKINFSENRAVLHTALRDQLSDALWLDNHNILPDIRQTLTKMREFTEQVRHQQWRGATGKPITDIVNIGIGGSHLGPLMTTHALRKFSASTLRCHFISNIDDFMIEEILKKINPETTLFIVSSKSFTTLETLANAKKLRDWLKQKLQMPVDKHFIAVTAAPQKALAFGIPEQQIFSLWDWVGGRYSIWSAIGLPLALTIGMDNFLDFLAGAYHMDQHFRDTPFEKNMPVILGLLGIWYINFFHASQHAIIPYTYALNYFPDYLQQLDMESNGKCAHVDHLGISYATGPVIFGKHGGDSQHSFFQLLHQGQHIIPVDFLVMGAQDQELLVAGALTQAQALMQGKSREQALEELRAKSFSEEKAQKFAADLTIPGNRPSNMLFLEKLTPFNLGSLIALYEHKVFVQSAIWGINSFDQWGVELGKQLLSTIVDDLQQSKQLSQYDASTRGLIEYYKKIRTSS